MSRYSGKCDLYDSLCMLDDTIDFDKLKIYIDGNIVPLDIKSQKDLAPYYPCIIGVSYGNTEGDRVIHMNSKLFYNTQEEGILKWRVEWYCKLYNRIKRKDKSKQIVVADLLSEFDDKEVVTELIQRVIDAKGKVDRVDYKDVYLSMSEHYRAEHYKTMVELGWDRITAYKWVYGYKRALKELKLLVDKL